MTIFEMMNALEACGDARVHKIHTNDGLMYDVTLCDFEGFDENWCEVMRDYEREDLVDEFLTTIDEQSNSVEGNFYYIYHFDDYCIHLGWESYDI